MEKPLGAVPLTQSELYDLEYYDGEKYVPVTEELGHVTYQDRPDGRHYTIQFDDAFIRTHGDSLKLGFEGMVVQVFPPPVEGPFWLARVRPGSFLDGIRLARLYFQAEHESIPLALAPCGRTGLTLLRSRGGNTRIG